MDYVVATTVPEQMPEDPDPEHHGRQHSPPAPLRIELHPRADDPYVDSLETGVHASSPLTEGQIAHLVTIVGQTFRETAIPTFGASRPCAEIGSHRPDTRASSRRSLADSALGSHRYSATFAARRRFIVIVGEHPAPRMSTVERDKQVEARSRGVDSGARVSVVIPCLNEAETIEECVRSAREVLATNRIEGEVIVVDNGSDDDSGRLAAGAGAFVVLEPERGYGSAYLAGFNAARGRYIVMADADLTYDFEEIPHFLGELEAGADVVIGNRMHNIHPGAMPWHHRYIGNPVLSGFLNVLFRTGVDDVHCGMRALRRDLLPRLDLRTTGMEFASEMVIRAAKEKLDVRQFAIEYHPRGGESKLSSFRDGWRHLRFLLVHSPNYLFILPGAVMAALGAPSS